MAYRSARSGLEWQAGWISVIAETGERFVVVVPPDVGEIIGFGWDDGGLRALEFRAQLRQHAGSDTDSIRYQYELEHGADGSGHWYRIVLTVAEWGAAGAVGNIVYAWLRSLPSTKSDDAAFAPKALSYTEAEKTARWVVCAEFHEGQLCACSSQQRWPTLHVEAVEHIGDRWTVTVVEPPFRYMVEGISGRTFYFTVQRQRIA